MLHDEKIGYCVNGTSMFILNNDVLEPGQRKFISHTHGNLEINLIKSGSGEYTVHGKTYEIKQGDIFLFNNIEPHWITNIDPPEPMTLLVIHFEPRFIWTIENGLFDMRYMNVFFESGRCMKNRLQYSEPIAKDIENILLEIEEEFSSRTLDFDLMSKAKLLNILVLLRGHFINKEKEMINYLNRKPNELEQHFFNINQVIDYIDNNLSEDIKLSDLAKQICLSEAYFSSYFKKLNGISPMRYLTIKRVYRAIEYIKATDKGMLEIALLCGFNNTANFNKSFLSVTGRAPSEFRKIIAYNK